MSQQAHELAGAHEPLEGTGPSEATISVGNVIITNALDADIWYIVQCN